MTPESMNLQAEIIRLKTELEDRWLVLKKAEKDKEILMQESLVLRDALERTDRELAELRDAVAWHFECQDTHKNFNPYIKQPNQGFRAAIIRQQNRVPLIEMKFNLQHAEQQLRKIGGEITRTLNERIELIRKGCV